MSERKNGHGGTTNGGGVAVQASLSYEQKELIREQLARILASPLFNHSKRFPDFLRYTIGRALEEDTDSIKERTLGVEVFGRDANYDTSLDPVVRMTAVEIRKRLAQYYQLPNHGNEPRIDFSRGSYVPEFRFIEDEPAPAAATAASAAGPGDAEPKSVARIAKKWRWAAAACVVLPALMISGFLLGGTRQTPVDELWAPVLANKADVLICVPDAAGILRVAPPANPTQTNLLLAQMPESFLRSKLSFGDVIALARIAQLMGEKNHNFRVKHTEDVALDDLKSGPVLLIGAFSNQWALRLDNGLRYSFVRDGDMHYIRDAQNPASRAWVDETKNGITPSDYAIVSRVLDPTTGHYVVTAAGLHQFGTQTAGECIVNLDCLSKAQQMAPSDWSKGNLEIVLKTSVIGENPGEPQVLAAQIW